MSAVVAGSVTGIDMNSDMGESFGRWTLGDDEALLDVVSSANVVCGFHAGDPSVMLRTLSYAASRGVMVGAHVAYRDLAGFGRRYVDESPDELKADVMYQIVEYGGLDGVHMTNVATVDDLVGRALDQPRLGDHGVQHGVQHAFGEQAVHHLIH